MRCFWTGVQFPSAPPNGAQANYLYYFIGGFAVYIELNSKDRKV